MASEDDDCTDCEGSGICHQTERYCTCSMGRELAALPPEGAAPNGCPICGAFMHLEDAGWEHPHSDTCPLDSIYIEQRHVEAWNARAHHFPEVGKMVAGGTPMTEYSDNLTEEDVEAVLRALPDHAITGDEIAMIITEIVMQFCDSPLEAVAILWQAVTFTAADGADQDGRVIQ